MLLAAVSSDYRAASFPRLWDYSINLQHAIKTIMNYNNYKEIATVFSLIVMFADVGQVVARSSLL